MSEDPGLPAPPAAEPEEPQERVLGALGGAIASSVVHLPLLALPYWGRDLSLLAGGSDGASTPSDAAWLAVAGGAVPLPADAGRLALHAGVVAMAAAGGLLGGAVLRALVPGRRSARAGAVAAFFLGIHPMHRPLMEFASQAPDAAAMAMLAFAAWVAVESALGGSSARLRLAAAVAGVGGGALAAPAALIIGPIILWLASRGREFAGMRAAPRVIAGCMVLGAVASLFLLPAVGLVQAGDESVARAMSGAVALLGGPQEGARRIIEGPAFAGVVLVLAGAILNCTLVAMLLASSARTASRNSSLAAAVAVLLAVAAGCALSRPAGLAVIGVAGLAYACVVALGFAAHVRAKSLLFVLALAGALFASEVERISPHPSAMERARVAGRLQASLRLAGREHATRKGLPMGELELRARDERMVVDLGGEAGIAWLLGEPTLKIGAHGAGHRLELTSSGAVLTCPAGE